MSALLEAPFLPELVELELKKTGEYSRQSTREALATLIDKAPKLQRCVVKESSGDAQIKIAYKPAKAGEDGTVSDENMGHIAILDPAT